MRPFPFAQLFITVPVLMACSETSPRERTKENQASILGADARADSTHDAVVAVLTGQGARCSGTIIRRNAAGNAVYVLTAAHCCRSSDAPAKIAIGSDYTQPSGYFPVTSFQEHPCYNPLSHDYDFCILQAKDEGALNIAPIQLATPPDDLTPGSPVTVVGYGN